MNRDILDRWCERGILALVLGILVLGPLALGAVGTLPFLIIQGLTLGVLGLWGARLWLVERPKILWTPPCWFVLAFAAYAAVRYLTCEIEYIGRQELVRVLVYTVLFFAVLNNLHRQSATSIVSATLIFLAMAISGYAVWQFVTGSEMVWKYVSGYKGRAGGTYICPNHLAGFLEMLLPLALTLTIAGRGRALLKILLGYAALVMLAGVGATVSRASWVACALALLGMFGVMATLRGHRLQALLAVLLLAGGCTFFILKTDKLNVRLKPVLASGTHDLDVRIEVWNATLRMWRDHPWAGVGPGHFDCRFRAYRTPELQRRPDRAHNEYLNTLADWGVAGLALVLATLAALFAGVVKTWKFVRRGESDFKKPTSNKFAFVLGATAGLVALVIHSMADFNMQIPANAILAVTLMALLSSHLRFASDNYWRGLNLPAKAAVTLVFAAFAAYLGAQEIRHAREFLWLDRVEAMQQKEKKIYSEAEIAAREKAFAVEPMNFGNAYELGEAWRSRAFEGGEDYEAQAKKATGWFARAEALNPHDAYSFLRHGMCLDYVGRHDEAALKFSQAELLDPNGYFTVAHVGWHFVQVEDYAAAEEWFTRSLRLEWKENQVAQSWLPIVRRKLFEAASGERFSPLR